MKGLAKNNVILVADDDLLVRRIIHSALKHVGKIIEVSDGSLVEKAYEEHKPDVVFLDIHLPNITGLDLIESLAKLDPNMYVIMVSADSSSENVKTALAKGCKGFLTKPFTKERILNLFNACPTVKFSDQ